jgi:hypothetical protein
MKKYSWFIILVAILIISTLACTISKDSAEIPVSPTPTFIPTVSPTCTVIPKNPIIAVVKADVGLNLRENSTENSKSLYLLKDGNELIIIGVMENGWSCVEFTDDDGKFYSGYVNSKYIFIVNVPPTVSPTPDN